MNLAMVLEMAADGLGDRRAIGNLTYADVRALARGVAGRLRSTAPPVTTLASLLPNGDHLSVALFGACWAGVSYAPLNFRLPEVVRAQLLARVEPAARFDESWLDEPDGGEPFVEDPERPAVLLFTSGTAAAPKAAVLHHDNLGAYLFNTLEFASAGEEEAALLAVPPFHIAGVAAVLSSTYVGRRIVPMAQFDADDWLRLSAAESVTHAFLVPTMLARIVAVLEADPSRRPPALRSLAYGGARMPRPVIERALDLMPEVDFVNAYGLTETSSTVAVLGPEDHREALASDDPAVRRRLESCGRPVPSVEFRIAGGEVWIRGNQVGGGYVGTESQVDAAGWLHTGDRGFLDDEGYLFVEGRGDDVIIRGGENISPAEIEDTLLRHPAVVAAAAVGLPDVEWGEKVVVMVVPRAGEGLDPTALQEWVRQELGSIKTPNAVVVADELPQTPTGKVLRREVRERLGDISGRSRT